MWKATNGFTLGREQDSFGSFGSETHILDNLAYSMNWKITTHTICINEGSAKCFEVLGLAANLARALGSEKIFPRPSGSSDAAVIHPLRGCRN